MAPQLPRLLASVTPSQLTNKACLPPNLPATQGNYTFNVGAIPPKAYEVCTPSEGKSFKLTVDAADKWAALTFINTGGFEILKASIDSHKMYVYAVDGQYITPQAVDTIVVNNGERYQVLIKLDQEQGEYAIRVANSGLNQIISGYGVLSYKGSTGPSSTATASIAVNGGNTTATVKAFNDTAAAPYPPNQPAPTADATFKFLIKKMAQPYGAWQWTLSGVSPYNQSNEDATPLLLQDPATVPATDLVIKTKNGDWVDLIVQVAGPVAQPHPMHKHSNKAFVIGGGVGTFNYSSVQEAQAAGVRFNLVNPPYRDGYTTTPAEGNSSWLAIRYQVLNPGAFLFHCHMQTHLTGGMAIAMLDGVDAWPSVPPEYTVGGNGIVVKGKKQKQKNKNNSKSKVHKIREFLGLGM